MGVRCGVPAAGQTSPKVVVGPLLIHVSDLTGGSADNAGMYRTTRRALIGTSYFAAGPARTCDDDDRAAHDRAQRAVKMGETRELGATAEILRRESH